MSLAFVVLEKSINDVVELYKLKNTKRATIPNIMTGIRIF